MLCEVFAVKQCPACRGLGPFGPNKSRPDGLTVYCRPCASAKMRTWRRTPSGRAYTRTRYAKHADAHKAHVAVNRALRTGDLVRPDTCEACGAQGPIESHHHRGYSIDRWLDVLWLCRTCHADADRAQRDEGIEAGNTRSPRGRRAQALRRYYLRKHGPNAA